MLLGLGCKPGPGNRAFSLGWCLTAHSESDFLPPSLLDSLPLHLPDLQIQAHLKLPLPPRPEV